MRLFEEIAVAFASALVAGDFSQARRLLSPALAIELTEAELRERLFGMFSGYADGPPTDVDFDEQFSLDDWRGKQFADAGWAYVSISGPDFVEVVAVIVSDVDGTQLIRDVEWGRP